MELLPEEALYLVEKGSLLCWEQTEGQENQAEDPEERREDLSDPVRIVGAPLSVQQSFAVMIGKADLTFERYQVYAYLRRFGYVVRRSGVPDSVPEWSVYHHPLSRKVRILSWNRLNWNRLLKVVAAWRVNWWKPMCFGLLDRSWGRHLNSSTHYILELRVRCSSQVPRICFRQASFDTDPEYLTSIWDSVQLAILIALLRLLSRVETFGFLDSTKYTTSRFRNCCYKVSLP